MSDLVVTAKKYCRLNTDTSGLIKNDCGVVKCPHCTNYLSSRQTRCHCNVRKLHRGDVIPRKKHTLYLSVQSAPRAAFDKVTKSPKAPDPFQWLSDGIIRQTTVSHSSRSPLQPRLYLDRYKYSLAAAPPSLSILSSPPLLNLLFLAFGGVER